MTSKKIKFATVFILALLAVTSALAFTKRSNAPGLHAKVSLKPDVSALKSDVPTPFNKEANSISNSESRWVVVNKTRTLVPLSYAPGDLVNIGGNQQMRKEAANAFKRLQEGAKDAGLSIGALSGYRSYVTQVSVYNAEVKKFGQAKADSESAHPGTSEHQTGWAVDVGGGGCGIEDCFGNTAEGKWLKSHAYEYGFIIRYTTEKQSITGYRAEPWHIRYIGSDLSIEMQKVGIATLEEFFGLPAAPDYK